MPSDGRQLTIRTVGPTSRYMLHAKPRPASQLAIRTTADERRMLELAHAQVLDDVGAPFMGREQRKGLSHWARSVLLAKAREVLGAHADNLLLAVSGTATSDKPTRRKVREVPRG